MLDALRFSDAVPDIRLVVVFVLHGDFPQPDLELVALFDVRHGFPSLAISHLAFGYLAISYLAVVVVLASGCLVIVLTDRMKEEAILG